MKAIVLSVRGCHPAYLGCYGNTWVSTPALDRLAATGVVFDQHLADVPETEAARRGWRDGRHHLPDPAHPESLSGAFDLLAALRGHGVKTVLVADGSHPLPGGWTAGWDENEVVRAEEGSSLEQTLEVARAALAHLSEKANWLLWIDLATLLPPWHVPADFSDPYFHDEDEPDEEEDEDEDEAEDEEEEVEYIDEDLQNEDEEDPLKPWPDPPVGPINTDDDLDFCLLQSTYAGAVSYLDAGIGVLLDEVPDDCLVIVTGDHGQALGEHGICGPYRPWLHDELLHIPLLVRLPGRTESVRVSAMTQTVDLAPTLLEAFELTAPPDLHGRSLLPLAREEAASIRPYVCSAFRVGEAVEWCLRTPEWALLLPVAQEAEAAPRKTQLYVKPDDRWEVNDVLQHRLELADGLERMLRAFVTASHQPGPLEVPAPESGTTTN